MEIYIAALGCFFLGILLGRYLMPRKKFDGSIDVTTNKAGVKIFSLNLEDSPHKLERMSSITFKVIRK